MTAPFAPELTSPANKAGSPTTVVTKWKFRSVVAGDWQQTYALRRRLMTPTIGSYEYWNGSTWVGSETFNTTPGTPADYKDGVEFIISTTGWTTDRVYQWSAKARNNAAEASPYADDGLIQVHAAPSMAFTVSSTAVSRPKLSWIWTGAAGYYQRCYQIAIYTAAQRNAGGFDASSATWQAQAVWLSAKKFSANDYRIQVDADLASGTQYYVFYKTEDNSLLSSGWVEATNFTPSYTAIPAPTIQATRDEANGDVNLIVRSSFNLLSDEQSIFNTGIGTWVGSLNCQSEWDSVNQRLIMRCGGMSYDALNALYASFTLEDGGYASFTAMAAAQASPAGTARMLSGDQTGERVAVTNGVAYSAIATFRNSMPAAKTVKIGIRWYTAAHAASTTPLSQSSGFTANSGVDTAVKIENITAPADAAWAVIEIEVSSTATVGDVYYIDNVALASTSTIVWSPSGNAFDVSFVVEHSADNVNWKPVWGCAKENPKASDSGAVSQITLDDRSVPLGTDLIYFRAYAISKFSTAAIWSSLATANVAGLKPEKRWLRRPEKATVATDVEIVQAEFSTNIDLNREVFVPEGATAPIVAYGSAPDVETVDLTITTLDVDTHTKVLNALKSTETLYVHNNVDGEGYYVRAVGSIKRQQRRAASAKLNNVVRHFYNVSVSAVVVKDPY